MGIIKVPREHLYDFIGTIVIDILHDAKGRGILVGHKLADITDIIAFTIAQESNATLTRELRNEIFRYALGYMCDLWNANISALGIHEIPKTPTCLSSPDWDYLRAIVTLPIRTVAERPDEDTFASLGTTNALGVESSNYAHQKDLLVEHGHELISFVSPRGINNPGDYFLQASGIVDIINTRTANRGKIVLDMKSAAGLIRTITDPIGYVTGLPTFADPGYNMPGMSAIRKYATVEFLSGTTEETLAYRGAQEYMYTIHLQLETLEPATLLHVEYFYGVRSGGLQRDNVCVSILNHPFSGTLPRSSVMAESLREYLKGGEEDITLQCSELLAGLIQSIVEVYTTHVPIQPPISQGTNTDFVIKIRGLQRGYNILFDELVTPNNLVTDILPNLMNEYNSFPESQFHTYCFCVHVINLLKSTFPTDENLLEILSNQWLPKRKGKLLTQIERANGLFNKECATACREHKVWLCEYFNKLTSECIKHLAKIWGCIHASIDDSEILALIPLFEAPDTLAVILDKYIQLHHPMLHTITNVPRGGLRVLAILQLVLKSACKYTVSLDTLFTVANPVHPGDHILETAQIVWGKFTGDFGQILWAMEHGHLFASEDNNTSAMALLLHRICDNDTQMSWGNIHGLGDGGSVDVILSPQK